jgi:hypothetical protein
MAKPAVELPALASHIPGSGVTHGGREYNVVAGMARCAEFELHTGVIVD